jgi:hypothetical protein
MPRRPISPASEEMFRICPERRRIMAFRMASFVFISERKFVYITFWNAYVLVFVIYPVEGMPALFIRMSIGPN